MHGFRLCLATTIRRLLITLVALSGAPNLVLAEPGEVLNEWRISETHGGFGGALTISGLFGFDVAPLGDLNGDGFSDLAVGVPIEVEVNSGRGVIWILFLDAQGQVVLESRIDAAELGLGSEKSDLFGIALANIGDLDGDGLPELAAGAANDADGGFAHGAVWILFLNADGGVRAHQKISDTQGGFTGVLSEEDQFGSALAAIGDLDRDGTPDLAVATPLDDESGLNSGTVWLLFLHPDGTVRSHQKINEFNGGFTGVLNNGDYFGRSVRSPGDLNADGVPDLVVGAINDEKGAVWILFLRPDGTVLRQQKIGEDEGGFAGALEAGTLFGYGLAAPGDLDGDRVCDLLVGAPNDFENGSGKGAVWVFFMNRDGTVKRELKINELNGGFAGALEISGRFGRSAGTLGDIDGDGFTDVVVSEPLRSDGGFRKGAVWLLSLDGVRGPACGDIDQNSKLDRLDAERLRDQLAGRFSLSLDAQSVCSVIGAPGGCDVADVAVLLRYASGLDPLPACGQGPEAP